MTCAEREIPKPYVVLFTIIYNSKICTETQRYRIDKIIGYEHRRERPDEGGERILSSSFCQAPRR